MALKVERISAVTFRVSNMNASVQFYRDVLGMEVLYGAEELRGSLPCVRKTRTLPSSIWRRARPRRAGVGSSFMSRMWMRSGEASKDWDSRLKDREMLLGMSGISTCSTRMGMSCRLRGRYNDIRKAPAPRRGQHDRP